MQSVARQVGVSMPSYREISTPEDREVLAAGVDMPVWETVCNEVGFHIYYELDNYDPRWSRS